MFLSEIDYDKELAIICEPKVDRRQSAKVQYAESE